MPAILSPSRAPPSPPRLRTCVSRPAVLVRCVYRPETTAGGGSVFPGVIGSNRVDWQSSCAILASKVDNVSHQIHPQSHRPDDVVVPTSSSSSSSSSSSASASADHRYRNNHHPQPAPKVDEEVNGSSSSSSSSCSVNKKKTTTTIPPPPPDQAVMGGLVHIDSGEIGGVNLPAALSSIADLCPAPMHGDQIRVAYQGVPGAYSEAAAGKAYPGCEAIPCDQFEVAFQTVELWIADRAVLPVENSLGGSIHRNYDLLLRHRLHIVGEVQLPVHHCLLALPGVRPDCLTRVISHPQALSQCELTLTAMGLAVAREAVDDTAGAAKFVAAHALRDTAAIASSRAAELYGLRVLADGIQDDACNVTRFVMLAREPVVPRTDRPFKTSIVFAHEGKGTSVLFKVLSAFAFRDISLTKIESRPHRAQPVRVVADDAHLGGTASHFEYMFYVDFQASMAEIRAQNALAEVQEYTSFLRVLGSYPMDMTPWAASASSSSSASAGPARPIPGGR